MFNFTTACVSCSGMYSAKLKSEIFSGVHSVIFSIYFRFGFKTDGLNGWSTVAPAPPPQKKAAQDTAKAYH